MKRIRRRPHESRGAYVVRLLRGKATTKMTTDQILALTRPST
jgi:hypothetical protein